MLILSRKVDQKLIINDEIEVVILETYKNSVKIGIKAPKNVQVYREEIYQEIKKANISSHNASLDDLTNVAKQAGGTANFNLTDTFKNKQ